MEDLVLLTSSEEKTRRVNDILAPLHLNEEVAMRIESTFLRELECGMKDGLASSCLQMENTYVPELLNGQESGRFLALDLGGTNFRVILLELEGGKIIKEVIEYYTVAESTRLGPGSELFDFLASCIHDFVVKHQCQEEQLPLGFTFSFPMTQNSLNSGILITWTKSFNSPGVVGMDAVAQLNDAIHRNGKLRVEVVAILNDTTGTLVKGSYDNSRTCIGLILGTGCNGAYLEKADKVLRWGGVKYEAKEVVVDPEFGAFGDNGCLDFIKTEFDRSLDAASLLPGSFTFEKYFAGKYIGELVRLILVRLHQEGLVFEGQNLSKLSEKDSVTTADLSLVEEDTVADKSDNSGEILGKLGLVPSADDIAVLSYICALLTHRCALLVAIPLACFLRRMAKESAAIAVTGSLYKCHPRLKILLERYTDKYSQGCKSETFLSDDGSGMGAGLVAAIASRLKSKQ